MSERVTVVVPCYNEERRLDTRAFADFVGRDSAVDFLFVNDGSKDATADVLHQLSNTAPERMSVLSLAENSGKAEAVRRGIIAAMDGGAGTVAFWDADLATPLDAITQFLQVLSMRPDISMVMGARVQLLGRSIARRPARHYLGRVFATVVSMVLGLRVYDTQCGAKMFRTTPEIRAIFSDPFRSRWIFDVELIARLLGRRGGTNGKSDVIMELPLWYWRDVAGSKLKGKDFAIAIPELARIWWHYLRTPTVSSAR
jgi:glycosyltransferase involved in cell wall biosynthesis